MTTYELTMGQIQTAEKHLALLDERAGRAGRAARAPQLPAHARAQPRRARATRRESRRYLLRALRLDPASSGRAGSLRRLVASRVKR